MRVLQGSAKGVPSALGKLRQIVAQQLQPPAGFQQELASQAQEGGLIAPGDWSEGSDKWTQAWAAICQVTNDIYGEWCSNRLENKPDEVLPHVMCEHSNRKSPLKLS